MTSSPWLLLDVSYLAYRAYFALGKLSFGEIATTVVYGVLREVISLQDTFNTKRVAFCFDHGKPLRKNLHPGYKVKRHEGKTEAELEAKLEVKHQIDALRDEHLPKIGFRNIFFQKGYEADDLLAGIALSRQNREFVIVTSDHDLFQVLTPTISIWNPSQKKLMTDATFRRDYGIAPSDWIDVKAMAGCKSDDIPGIAHVGEATAAKYLRGELTKGKTFDAIEKAHELVERNRKLVELPFPGLTSVRLLQDDITPDGWNAVVKRLGMNSLAGSIPGIPRRSGKRQVTRNTLGVW